MYKRVTYFVCFCLISNLSGTLIYKFKFQEAMEQMIEQPQPPEGDEATTGTMSPLAAVRSISPLIVQKAPSCVILGWLSR